MFLSVKGLKRSFGMGDSKVDVLNGIDLEIEKGEFLCILGQSGCGKSTLLNIIGGIDSPDEGSICLNNKHMEKMSQKELTMYRRDHLGYIFQMYNLVPDLTVRENVEVGAYLSKDPLDVDEIIELTGLKDHQNKIPNQISGGQQQRTSIGRALVKKPEILLCDEPTGALDYKTSKEILALIEDVNRKYKTTVIMVTHNAAIKHMSDRTVELKDGRVVDSFVNEHKVSAVELEW
ncbi:MAG: ABC transporter ATP-binding protein [Clostridiales bacterium]|nr:ABC transporter ATP-binding protein [Clostridiales bacterium]MBS5878134.1 ABC transporter ATP-binding protein [Clostridiales bacterium]MDU0939399.1 ABC transporter ATP-binding protein [Clostridiales bacterium]MDU1042383.1 ABC transporter ATP-binding protein [Clostridiales bacterium]